MLHGSYAGRLQQEWYSHGAGHHGVGGDGTAFSNGSNVGSAGVTWAKGDELKIEYDSDKKILKWYKNGNLVGYQPGAALAMTHLVVGRGAFEGAFEVRLEDSSFMLSARGAGALLQQLEGYESDCEERAFVCGSTLWALNPGE